MRRASVLFAVLTCWMFCLLASGVAWAQDTTENSQDDGSCPNLRTLATIGPQVSDEKKDFQSTTDRFRVTYEVDFKNDGPLQFRDFSVEILSNFGLVEFDSAERDGGKSFIVITEAGRYSIETDVTPNNGATYTAKVEECSETPPIREEPEGDPAPPERMAPEEGAPEVTPVEGQYKKPGNVSNPKDIVPGTEVAKKVPVTGGPSLMVGAVVLLAGALVAGFGVLRR